MSTIFQLLMPCLWCDRYGARNLILVGDPRQLPATVLSPVVTKYKYEVSLFERLEKGGHPVRM